MRIMLVTSVEDNFKRRECELVREKKGTNGWLRKNKVFTVQP